MANPMFPVPKGAMAQGATDDMWLAGLAMQAIVARTDLIEKINDQSIATIANLSLNIAEALVAERRRRNAK